jgi:hypothetical protein
MMQASTLTLGVDSFHKYRSWVQGHTHHRLNLGWCPAMQSLPLIVCQILISKPW